MKKFIKEKSIHLINENDAMIEVLGVEPSLPVVSMSWDTPYVDVQVRVYDEEKDFSVYFTINKYVVSEEYLPENWHDMSSEEIWNVVHQNILGNVESLNVLNMINPLGYWTESKIEDFLQKEGNHNRLYDDYSDEEISNITFEESHKSILIGGIIEDFEIWKSECAIGGNSVNDYITDFHVDLRKRKVLEAISKYVSENLYNPYKLRLSVKETHNILSVESECWKIEFGLDGYWEDVHSIDGCGITFDEIDQIQEIKDEKETILNMYKDKM